MNQEVYFGPGSIKHIKDIFAALSVQKLLVVAGKKSFVSSGAQAGLEPFFKNLHVTYIQDISPNPDFKEILLGLEKNDPSAGAVVAVGGGSPMDVAKSINLLSVQEGEPLEYVHGDRYFKKRGKPLIAIPTTSGSGSEATQFSVFYFDGVKHSLEHEYLIPDFVIIDPLLTMSMPRNVAASSGMDALSHAIESYWSIHSTEESREYAKKAIRIILSVLRESVNTPDLQVRAEMSNAANLAGRAINITRTTVSHALAYALTKFILIPHGHAAAFTLGRALEYNADVSGDDCNDARGPAFVHGRIREILGQLGVKTPAEGKALIQGLMQDIGLETDGSKLGLNDKIAMQMISSVNISRLRNNPRSFKKTCDLRHFYL